jgi:hypothetical protein
MMDERLRQLVAGYVDGELSGEELAAFKRELSTNAELRAEVEEFKKIKEVTGAMTYADLPDEVWDTYWSSLYRKTERGLGWILFSASVIVLLAFGAWQAFSGLWANPDTPLWLKLGASGGALGVIILLVSYGRERLFAYKRERYSEVEK